MDSARVFIINTFHLSSSTETIRLEGATGGLVICMLYGNSVQFKILDNLLWTDTRRCANKIGFKSRQL